MASPPSDTCPIQISDVGTANPVQALVPAARDLQTSHRRGEGNRAVRLIAEVPPRTVTGRPTRPLDRLLGNALHHEDEIRWSHAQHLPREVQVRINMGSPLAPPTKEAPPRAPTDTAWILKSCIRISNQSRVRQSQMSPKKGTAGRKDILMWKSMAIIMNANTVVAIAVAVVERVVAAILDTTAGISLQKEAIVMTKKAAAVEIVVTTVATVVLTALVPQRLIKITMNMVY